MLFLEKTKTFWLKYFQNKMWEWLSSRNYILLLLENKKQLILRSKWCNYIKWFFKIFLFWLSSAFHTEKPNVVFYLGPTYSGMIHFLLSPLWWHKRSLDQMGWCFDKQIATFHLLKKKKEPFTSFIQDMERVSLLKEGTRNAESKFISMW